MPNPKKHSPDLDVLYPPSGLPIYHLGPSLEQGALPGVVYFALSGPESLTLDPYNQPIAFLNNNAIRSFSFTLPFHGEGYDNVKAMSAWSHELKHNPSFLQDYLKSCAANIDYLIKERLVDSHRIAAAGLSRGGFIAAHLAALHPKVGPVLGFAPLINPADLEEFQPLPNEVLDTLNLANSAGRLIHKRLRFYIGNRDTRVKTESCYQFIKLLTELAYQGKIRSPQAELILFPSIGHKGHGTPSSIFESGADWLNENLIAHR